MTTLPHTELENLAPPADSAMWRKTFLFGAATAAYQIEGATKEDGRLPSIWDTFSATPGRVLNGDTGEHACDHYHRWAADLDLLSDLHVDAYRLSLAWPRVMDEHGRRNDKGLDFYKRLLDRLQEKDLKAFVTLYHWDLPQHLQDRGGWVNRDTVHRFADYADLMSRELAGRVTAWTTFNEPWVSAYLGYASGDHAPGMTRLRDATQAMHHLLLAHGTAVPILRANDPGASVGIVANVVHGTPNSSSAEDQRAAYLFGVQANAWVLDPLLKKQYPEDLWVLWPGNEPAIAEGDMETIGVPTDYLGLNYYFRSRLASDGGHGFVEVQPDGVERTQMGWEVYPDGLRQLMVQFKSTYANLPPIYITENGLASADMVSNGEVADTQRVRYVGAHLRAIDQAMREGVDVRGYFVWSLLDNFEWSFGYERRFGIVHVDFDTQVRTPKHSAHAIRAFLRRRKDL